MYKVAFWLVHSISVISSYTLVWPYMENDYAEETQFLSDKAAEKSRFRQDPPRVFDMLQYFETILPSVESLWSS